jgi:Winged helix-turn-helix DNA-binding
MPPEATVTPDTPQPISESPSPVIETPAPATEPTTSPAEASPATTAPEASPTPTEAAPAPETGPQGPLPFSKTDDRQENQVAQPSTQTGQMAGNEPLAPKPDPIPPPSAAAPQAQPIIVPPTGNFIRNLLAKASAKIQSKKKAKLEKILQVLNTKNKITNDEVQKLLRVSDATATRYLSALAKEGKIKQVGKTGTGVVYQKV